MSDDHTHMPPERPIAMPEQNLAAAFRDSNAPDFEREADKTMLWRLIAFAPAILLTSGLVAIMINWFSKDGINALEAVLMVLIAFNFFWISLSLFIVTMGLASLGRMPPPRPRQPTRPINVALLVPVYNEAPAYVLGNIRSMHEALKKSGGQHRYTFFILSDTQEPGIARDELVAIMALRRQVPGAEIYYRRRVKNTGRKVGNIADWVTRWGGGWEAMLVLDADSLMTGRAIARLADTLSRDESAGLIQSFPQLIGAQSLFGRMQQFASSVYGSALAEGFAMMSGHEGNYWGHNAIIRTKAFAACAGLPEIRSLLGRPADIMSHDFVEAGLLRRAGWSVRFLPRVKGSYEEAPQTLIDYILRDRRWCQGNMQHLRLLATPGLRGMSRFYMFHGAIGYLLSPIWFALLIFWALIGRGEDANVLTYFNPDNPLMPSWPNMSDGRQVLVILLMYAILLVPKLLGIIAIPVTGGRFADYGGAHRFSVSFLLELVLSVAYAPVLMVQQMIAVFRAFLGLQKGWAPQARDGGRYGLNVLIRSHLLETISGAVLSAGIAAGLVSLWLLPIALSLVLAIPLSAISGYSLKQRAASLLATAEEVREPAITRSASLYRRELQYLLNEASLAPGE